MKYLIAIAIAGVLLLFSVNFYQGRIIEQQRTLIEQMTQNPACIATPTQAPSAQHRDKLDIQHREQVTI
jgi:hypothetical protein